MTGTKESLSAQEKYKLRTVRDIADEVIRLQERLDELEQQTIASPKLDGMPRSGNTSDAMAAGLIQRQAQAERLQRAQKRLKRAQKAAERIVAPMPARMRLFYQAYYIEGEKLQNACSIARISESTAYRYMRIAGEQA